MEERAGESTPFRTCGQMWGERKKGEGPHPLAARDLFAFTFTGAGPSEKALAAPASSYVRRRNPALRKSLCPKRPSMESIEQQEDGADADHPTEDQGVPTLA